MNRSVANTLGIALIALCCLAAWGGYILVPHLIAAVDKWGNAAPDLKPTLDRANATLDLVDRPCMSVDKSGHLLPDGPMCQFTQFLHDLRKITTASGKQVQQTGALITATAQNMNTVGDSIKQVAGKLSGTADAATGTLNAATDTLGEGKRTIAAAQPLLVAYTRSGEDLDALLKQDALRQTLNNVAGITDNMNGVTLDFKRVTDKATNDYLSPKPWWKKTLRYAGDAFDYGALAARHTP